MKIKFKIKIQTTTFGVLKFIWCLIAQLVENF